MRPTQFAYGLLEVESLLADCEKLRGSKLRRLVRAHPISVVLGPDREPYIVDGHHHAYLFRRLGVKKIFAQVLADYSRTRCSHKRFWSELRRKKWVHLFDQFGTGPRDPVYLPEEIEGLADDPYRSLAWLVQKKGGFAHTEVPFAGFAWANFFRDRRVLHDRFRRDYDKALKEALRLCRSAAARKLPGWKKV